MKDFFFIIRPPPELLPVLGPLEQYVMPTLNTALLCSSRAGSDLGRIHAYNTPAQSEVCYQTTTLPPSHHGWIHSISY